MSTQVLGVMCTASMRDDICHFTCLACCCRISFCKRVNQRVVAFTCKNRYSKCVATSHRVTACTTSATFLLQTCKKKACASPYVITNWAPSHLALDVVMHAAGLSPQLSTAVCRSVFSVTAAWHTCGNQSRRVSNCEQTSWFFVHACMRIA